MVKVTTGKQFSGTMDMAFAGTAMLRNPKLINEWTRNLFANEFPFTWGILQLLGDEVDEQVTDSGIYRIGSCGINNRPVFIIGFTGTPKCDQDIYVTLTDGWMRHGATGMLGDGKTMLRLDDDGITAGNYTTYRARIVGNNPSEVCPAELLQDSSPFNFKTAIYGEASKTGHPVNWSTGDLYLNTMTTVRTKVSWTGDFLSEGMEIEVSKTDKNKAPMLAFLPGSVGFYKEHMKRVDYWNIHGVSNFDPISGKIYGQTSRDEKQDVVSGSGLYDIVEKCGIPMVYNPLEVLAGRRLMSDILDEAIGLTSRYTQDEMIAMMAIGGQIAMKCVEKATQEKITRENIHLELRLDSGIKSIDTHGLYFKYQSTFGTLQVMWNKYVDEPNAQYNAAYSIPFGGQQFPLRSGDLIIVPIVKMADKENPGKTKPSLSLFSKGKNTAGMAINRKLVFGFFRGMTGLTNSVPTGNAKNFLKEFKEYAASTAQDADQAELLSQTMLILRNADKCIHLRAVKS